MKYTFGILLIINFSGKSYETYVSSLDETLEFLSDDYSPVANKIDSEKITIWLNKIIKKSSCKNCDKVRYNNQKKLLRNKNYLLNFFFSVSQLKIFIKFWKKIKQHLSTETNLIKLI